MRFRQAGASASRVDGFWPAFSAGSSIGLVSLVLSLLFRPSDSKELERYAVTVVP